MMHIEKAHAGFLTISGRQPQGLLKEVFLLGFAPRQQGHAGEKGRGPVADLVETLLKFEIVPVQCPRAGLRFIRQAFDITARLANA